jgi:hypothetical protein
MKILLGDFNAEVGREDIFRPTIRNDSLHEISNDNGVRIVNFATSKSLTVKSTTFTRHNIYKFTMKSPYGKTHSQLYYMADRSGQQIVILTTIWWWQKLGRDWQ